MIPNYLSAMWTAIAPALGNHLWQSTLFAITVGSLTLLLRNNQARARYWLWLAASVKFLIPFSLLVAMGSHLPWSRNSAGTKAGLYFAMEEVSQPFTQPTMSMMSRATPATVSSNLTHLLPAVLTAAWLSGFLVVVFVWYLRWRRISAAIRKAVPLRDGREVEALRWVERIAGVPKRTEIFLSRTSLEPGIFGIARPVLIWPQGISERLEDAHLAAILAHELWHVRRRDNLAAATHMVVEAIFWFHPLVWWLGARLVDERERACDEEVLESGSDSQVYAESILQICEFCVGSPLPCVSGVTGADLKRRIVRIMSDRVARKLDFRRKLLLAAAPILAVAAPIVAGILHATPNRAVSQAQNTIATTPAYATVSITPNQSGSYRVGLMFAPGGFTSKNASLQQVIRAAYGVEDDRISGAPAWLESEKYDVEAKVSASGSDDLRNLSVDQRISDQKSMLQALLADRLKLALHRETRDLNVYGLVIAKNGPKLQESKPGDTYPNGFKGPDGIARPSGIHFDGQKLIAQGVPIGPLLFHLSRQLHRTILDETALSGTYDFTLKLPDGVPLGIDNAPPPESYAPAVSAAIDEQLGLKLEPKNVPLEVLVIDHVEKPESQSEAASSKLAFNSASVTLNKSAIQDASMNVTPASGLLSGTNVRLISYIYFAYNLTGNQFQLLMPQLPKWVISDHFDIQARADGNPSKDQMRLMMQSLLADRFKLASHYETRRLPVFALVLVKPGTTGPQLQPHPEDSTCSTALSQTSAGVASAPTATVAGGLPTVCGGIEGMPPSPSGRLRAGARGVPIGLLASTLAQIGNLDRAVLDRTGLSGNFDFTFEWTPQLHGPGTPQEVVPVAANAHSGQAGPTFQQDLQEQLGLNLERQEGPVEVLVIDHIEKPAEN